MSKISSQDTRPSILYPIHLVGSIPLKDAEAVFSSVANTISKCVHSVPDGETGVRSNWLLWQEDVFSKCQQLRAIEAEADYSEKDSGFQPKPGISADQIEFGNLGYADAALSSYQSFRKLKEAGHFNADTRFQVSLPTPLAVAHVFFSPDCMGELEPVYEQAMMQELKRITESIPADQLAVQWDVAIEIMLLEMEDAPLHFEDRMGGITERLVRLLDSVSADIEVGLHLCYGDSEHKHFKEPEDTRRLLELANAVSTRVKRSINWIHMPVPIDRSDDQYFAPLAELSLQQETTLYLGLVHYTDGVEGTRKRIKAAKKIVNHFGIATECGFGRRDPATIHELLNIHAKVALE